MLERGRLPLENSARAVGSTIALQSSTLRGELRLSKDSQ
jgi:hypothetical protein